MSNPQQIEAIPQPTRGDRIRMAMRQGGVSSSELEDYLGVTRYSVSRWINDRSNISVAMMRLLALRCGVPYAWLKDGESPRPDPDEGQLASRLGESNSRPSHYKILSLVRAPAPLRRVA